MTDLFAVAIEDIEADEDLFSIPYDLVLSVKNSSLKNQIPDQIESLDPWLSLILVMMHESSKGETSRWSPYWKILPEHFDTLMYWSESELQELQGSAVITKVGKSTADTMFITALFPIIEARPELFGFSAQSLSNPEAANHLLQTAHRMATLIMAYAFDLEGENDTETPYQDGYLIDDEADPPKGMVPLADTLNADADRNNARLYHEDSMLIMKAVEAIKQGEEIYNHYGCLPRSDLLRRYGYITEHYKEFDVVEISTASIQNAANLCFGFSAASLDRRMKLAQRWDIWDDSFDLTRDCGERQQPHHGFEYGLLQTLQIHARCDEELDAMESMKAPPSAVVDPRVASLLTRVVVARREEFSTTLAEDVILLRKASGRRKQAIEVRLGEKEILASILQYLTEELKDTSVCKNMISNDDSRTKKRKL